MNFPEIIFFAVLGLLVFGPQRLPEIARVVAKTMNELRRASNEFKQSLEDEIHNLETPAESQAHRDLLPDSVEPYTGRDLDPAWDSDLDELEAGAENADEEDALAEAEWSREDDDGDAAMEDDFLDAVTDDWAQENETAPGAIPAELPPAAEVPPAAPASAVTQTPAIAPVPAAAPVSAAQPASPPRTEPPARRPDPAPSPEPAP